MVTFKSSDASGAYAAAIGERCFGRKIAKLSRPNCGTKHGIQCTEHAHGTRSTRHGAHSTQQGKMIISIHNFKTDHAIAWSNFNFFIINNINISFTMRKLKFAQLWIFIYALCSMLRASCLVLSGILNRVLILINCPR